MVGNCIAHGDRQRLQCSSCTRVERHDLDDITAVDLPLCLFGTGLVEQDEPPVVRADVQRHVCFSPSAGCPGEDTASERNGRASSGREERTATE
ncbi:hypothetical protein C2R22_23400 (plasmid) [Salinigranum rubrum]|uniref:Uncharacterized protein n=1 Tax=Salinigranum rubrum TaxID=755307 RepID=A0A2I8VRL4_9EURY|nr:hypothetical protein C2R22_23400 [Salinigranum rubrum]